MEKPRIKEVIVVEGKYDKNTVSQAVIATVIDTSGFGVFKDAGKLEMLRKIALSRGLIIMTDGDGAGFLIRNYLKGALNDGRVLHAYIPDIEGKEKRKKKPSAEGKLGVEGVGREVIIDALRRAGATFDDAQSISEVNEISNFDMYRLGLSGGADSKALRLKLVKKLGLPEKISSAGLNDYLRITMSLDELTELVGVIRKYSI